VDFSDSACAEDRCIDHIIVSRLVGCCVSLSDPLSDIVFCCDWLTLLTEFFPHRLPPNLPGRTF
jgi:hypothetical protein